MKSLKACTARIGEVHVRACAGIVGCVDTFKLLLEAASSLAQATIPPEIGAALTESRLMALSKPDGEQVHVGVEKDDLAEMKAKLSTALAAKEALMIGPHSTDIANRLDQEILTLRRALTDQRPLGEQLAGILGVIVRGEKRLNLVLTERESAKDALQAAETKIAQQRHELQEHQHGLETLQAKIVSTTSNATANTGFQEDSTGMTPPIRNMLTNFLNALKSGMSMESTEVIAAFESVLIQQSDDYMDSASREDLETPTDPWTTVKSRRLRRKTFKETPQLDQQQLQLQN